MFFQTKKVKLETLPEYLKAVRQELGLSPQEVAARAGMPLKVLHALEAGALEDLPASVYVKGFLTQLSEVYRVDKNPLLRQFEIERRIIRGMDKNITAKSGPKGGWFSGLAITPKSLSLGAALVFAVLTVVYIIWQIASIGRLPVLGISSPEDLAVIEKSSVEVVGRTDPGATLTINNEPVFVDSEGKFTANVGVVPGPKELVIVSKNRFNKVSTRVLTIIGQSRSVAEQQNFVKLELEFVEEAVISYKIDGAAEVSESLPAGGKKTLEAKKQILFSTDNAGAIKAKINGQNLGLLGREGERLVDIPFSAESGNIK